MDYLKHRNQVNSGGTFTYFHETTHIWEQKEQRFLSKMSIIFLNDTEYKIFSLLSHTKLKLAIIIPLSQVLKNRKKSTKK